ncbi:MAG: metallophosphoesterase family protein [Acidobacteria bacterium]|nr:metallophosphoesterase family protein [Acidobacteriota bacterium]
MPVNRVAAIYDIHGNLPALRAVLGEIESLGVDHVLVGGDVVPGPLAGECLDVLLSLPIPASFLRGNGERNVVSAVCGGELDPFPEPVREALYWVAGRLSPEQLTELATWPLTHRLEVQDLGPILFCHATPRSDHEIFTSATAEEVLKPLFEDEDTGVVLCGHTHIQFDRRVGGVRVINAGSVGMPFGEPGAFWALLGPEGVELRRTSYDLEAATERLAATGYPMAFEIRRPPAAAQMLEIFEAAVLR